MKESAPSWVLSNRTLTATDFPSGSFPSNTGRQIRRSNSVAPPTTPSMIARWLCALCFFLGIIVTCGVSIEGEDASSHMDVEKERHKFPDVLHNIEEMKVF